MCLYVSTPFGSPMADTRRSRKSLVDDESVRTLNVLYFIGVLIIIFWIDVHVQVPGGGVRSPRDPPSSKSSKPGAKRK